MAEEDFKNLPPEERIKKLKELEKKKKKEIEEGEKLIKESETEISDKIKWVEKVPIPQIASEDVKQLSVEEKEIFKTHKGTNEKKEAKENKDEKPKKETAKEESTSFGFSLEDAVSREAILIPQGGMGQYHIEAAQPRVINSDYVASLSRQPTEKLYHEIAAINKGFEDRGYLTSQEGRRVDYITGAIDEKMKAVDAGHYSLTEDTALAASLIQQLGSNLRNAYHAGSRKNEMYK